ncbi:ATP-binding protein [Streptomyces sp. NPDC018833]|uniref:ATP-binding protein n=1 Tax=Streptomyces sp. NPDC018833 TaxID=3365053 RepID=UPI0037B718FD
MPTSPPHAIALAGMLAAATRNSPRITEIQGAVRIEIDLPQELSGLIRSIVLTTLGAADRYGHDYTADGDAVWAEIDRKATAVTDIDSLPPSEPGSGASAPSGCAPPMSEDVHDRTIVLDLLAFPKALPALRHTLREHLGRPCTDVLLCVSELFSNVVRHLGEGTPVTVRVKGTHDGRTRIEVTDPDPRALPVLLHAATNDESGRGLALLDAVALRWGVAQGPESKTVWCEVEGG